MEAHKTNRLAKRFIQAVIKNLLISIFKNFIVFLKEALSIFIFNVSLTIGKNVSIGKNMNHCQGADLGFSRGGSKFLKNRPKKACLAAFRKVLT